MYEQIAKPKENKNRAVASSVTQHKTNGKQGFGFVDNRNQSAQLKVLISNAPKGSVTQLKPTVNNNNSVIQGEFATATCSAAGATATSTSKDNQKHHWVTYAMNKIATVEPKTIPDGEGHKVVPGNEKFQCAEPKSLSKALNNGLEDDEIITKVEVDDIKWTNIKWCEGDRDGQNACTCPTCTTWLDSPVKGSATPNNAAKAEVKTEGEKVGKYFADDAARDTQREANEKARKKEENHKQFGQYLAAVEGGATMPPHKIVALIKVHRDKFELYVQCNVEIKEQETEMLKIPGGGGSKSEKEEKEIACEAEITRLEAIKTEIMDELELT